MSVRRKVKKTAKFLFVGIPLRMIGVNQLRLGNSVIHDLWSSLRGISCPSCKKALLSCELDKSNKNEAKDATQYTWVCSNCSFAVFAPNDIKSARAVIRNLNNKDALAELGNIEFSDLQKRVLSYARKSRFFFVIGLATFIWFLYELSTGSEILYTLQPISLGSACIALALKFSYRAWQLETRTHFVEGAFLRFLKNERWFR